MNKDKFWKLLGDLLVYGICIIAALITLVPLLHILALSLADQKLVIAKDVFLIPWGLNFESYKLVVNNPSFLTAYGNTIWVTVIGTLLNLLTTFTLAYPLSQKNFCLRRPIMLAITFTMFFSGGLIPSYIVVSKMGLIGSRWAMIIPSAISTWNLIITRTFFENIPDSLFESARLDGASEMTILFKIVLPVSTTIIAVMTLYYAVAQWNTYMSAILYVTDSKMHPLQVFLRRVLLQGSEEMAVGMQVGSARDMAVHQLKYSAIIMTILPIVCIYPFLQKYFVKGVMIGAVKG
ncbi:MAG: carbohydrate ABC transporter permease [Clostridia bacterium]|nr:carbohydrate ABC transporter permease [Clostridiales bacterium]MBQ6804521.1 carbohydrate ABC transporter permease [Clostridia bacterium]